VSEPTDGEHTAPPSGTPLPAAPLPVLVVGRPQRVTAAMPAGAPAISADGWYVAFVSESGNLVEGDDNGAADVFVRDLVTNRTVLVSRSRFGGSPAGSSLQPSISADGQVIAFTSSAPDLVPGDSNGTLDVFVHDLRTGRTEMVSRGSAGELADNDSFSPSLSADGIHVAFSSMATNLDPRDANPSPVVYLHDRRSRLTRLVSVSSGGQAGDGPSGQPSVSGDGRLVAFTSAASNLDPDDANGLADVYVRDLESGTTELVSRGIDGVAADGLSSEPSISADGRAIAFTSSADDLVPDDENGADDVFVHRLDAQDGEHPVRLASTALDGGSGSGASHGPSISGDGSRLAFLSTAPDLVPSSADGSGAQGAGRTEPATRDSAYVRDLHGAGTALVSAAANREPGNGEATATVVSDSGSRVAFADTSTDLAGQTELAGAEHVYVASVRTASIPVPTPPVNARRRRRR
jgi:Tol biopolymer transport system component